MKIILALTLIFTFTSCETVRITETVQASRETTRDAFGEYVIGAGGTLLEVTDMTARGELPVYRSGAERVALTLLSGATRREYLRANFAGDHPCTLVIIPQSHSDGALVDATQGVPATEAMLAKYRAIARSIKLRAERR